MADSPTQAPEIVVCDWSEAQRLLGSPAGKRFEDIVSFRQHGSPVPGFVARHPAPRKLCLDVDDVTRPSAALAMMGYRAPRREDVLRIVAFCEQVRGPTLIHCAEGISRSTAAATVLLNVQRGPGHEEACIDALLELRSIAWPNGVIVALADQLLERGGAMIAAHEARFEACPEPGLLT